MELVLIKPCVSKKWSFLEEKQGLQAKKVSLKLLPGQAYFSILVAWQGPPTNLAQSYGGATILEIFLFLTYISNQSQA